MKSKITIRFLAAALCAALALCGCQSSQTSDTSSSSGAVGSAYPDKDKVARAYGELKSQIAPLPNPTPYDNDQRLRGAYLAGFNYGWSSSIRGEIVYGVTATPQSHLDAADLASAWKIGWQEGARRGTDALKTKLAGMQ